MKLHFLNIYKANTRIGEVEAELKTKTDEFVAVKAQLDTALEQIKNFDIAKKAYEDQFTKEKEELIKGHEEALADMSAKLVVADNKAITTIASLGIPAEDIKPSKVDADIMKTYKSIASVAEQNKFYIANKDAILAAEGVSK